MDWKHFSKLVIETVDPALQKVPKYIFDSNESVGINSALTLGNAGAWTSRVLDLQLAEYLITRNSWRGRGFATIVSPMFRSLTDVGGMVLHELCHWLDFGAPTGPVSDAIERSRQLLNIERQCSTARPGDPPKLPQPKLPSWHNHGLNFVRAGCHVAYRVARRIPCSGISPDKIRFASGYYGNLAERDFMGALSRELITRSGEPISWILKSPAPKSFSDLWHSATGTKPKPKPPTVRRFDGKLVVMRATVGAAGNDGGLFVTLADEELPRTWQGKTEYLSLDGFSGRAGNHSIPVIRDGDSSTVRNIVGSIRSATVQGHKLVGVLRFVDDADGQTFAQDVQAGKYELRLVVDATEGYELKEGEQFAQFKGPATVLTSWTPLRVDAIHVERV